MAIKNGVGRNPFAGYKGGVFLFYGPLPIVGIILAALVGLVLGILNSVIILGILSILVVVILIVLRLDELAVTLVIAAHLYVDFYLGLRLGGVLMAFVLLVAFYLGRSTQKSWTRPRALWLWIIFLIATILPAIRGNLNLYDTLTYYPSVIFGAFIMFWLGSLIAHDIANLRLLFNCLVGLATILALFSIIQARTGTLPFASTRYDSNIAMYVLSSSVDSRVGIYFVDPNWNGTFLALMILLAVGLFADSKVLLAKGFHLVEIFLIFLALLFTYSNGAWISAFGGISAYVIFVGLNRYRLLLPLLLIIPIISMELLFPSQVALLLQRASDPREVLLRLGAWGTGIEVIKAFPLLGVGLGYQAYLFRSNPYRLPLEYIPLEQPHNSYLEVAAMVGIPLLILFLTILFISFAWAIRNWNISDRRSRPLLGSGIASIVALTINSISINGWTHPVVGDIGWLILGAISSPLLMKSLLEQKVHEADKSLTTDNKYLNKAELHSLENVE
jgi:O-antigen ligase